MSGTSLIPERKRRRVEINIIPLIDVLVVLIFFFLFSMQFRNLNVLDLKLPELETAGKSSETRRLEIAVTADGQVYYNGEPVDDETLRERLALAGKINREVLILILADEASPLKSTTRIMDLCRKNGLETLRLQAR